MLETKTVLHGHSDGPIDYIVSLSISSCHGLKHHDVKTNFPVLVSRHLLNIAWVAADKQPFPPMVGQKCHSKIND